MGQTTATRASGQKAIVFSQWVQTLEKISRRLSRFGPLQYHGKISPARRDEIIERFRREKRHHVLLMSYGAGSVGLNLQFCGYVFLFDRWWNPAVEDQAINRAHRIGAQGPVTVTRMLTLRDPRSGWDGLIGGDLTIVRIPGHHHEIMREPHVESLAQGLKAALSEAQAAPATTLQVAATKGSVGRAR